MSYIFSLAYCWREELYNWLYHFSFFVSHKVINFYALGEKSFSSLFPKSSVWQSCIHEMLRYKSYYINMCFLSYKSSFYIFMRKIYVENFFWHESLSFNDLKPLKVFLKNSMLENVFLMFSKLFLNYSAARNIHALLWNKFNFLLPFIHVLPHVSDLNLYCELMFYVNLCILLLFFLYSLEYFYFNKFTVIISENIQNQYIFPIKKNFKLNCKVMNWKISRV